MRLSWLESRDETRVRAVALLPLAAVAGVTGGAARLRRALYRVGALGSVRLSGRVVSVGNLTVGGSGKTPTAAWIARELHRRGHKVVLASRGYAGRRRDPVLVVSDGRFVRARAESVTIIRDDFGELDGQAVDLYTLENANGLQVKITNYGAIVTELHMPDRDGNMADIALGFDTLAEYVDHNPYYTQPPLVATG